MGTHALALYSTGRLTTAQALVLDGWRARLRLDRPLPGIPPVSPAMRRMGLDDRPRASCSDAIAVATAWLVEHRPPRPLAVARYAERTRSLQVARSADAPRLQPVSWYLPEEVAALVDRLRTDARVALDQVTDGAVCRTVTGGTLARMAIDAWADRDPEVVCLEAVAWAAEIHDQPHRARRDMITDLTA